MNKNNGWYGGIFLPLIPLNFWVDGNDFVVSLLSLLRDQNDLKLPFIFKFDKKNWLLLVEYYNNLWLNFFLTSFIFYDTLWEGIIKYQSDHFEANQTLKCKLVLKSNLHILGVKLSLISISVYIKIYGWIL